MAALSGRPETLRACLLGLINAAYTWNCMPWLWPKVPIAPVPKPGKDPSSFDGYRSIYLLAGIFKLYDKMLFNRINGPVRNVSEHWQAGGSRGADMASWILDAVLRARRRKKGGAKTWMAFLDAEAAYCRPPKSSIMRGLATAKVRDDDWLATRSILDNLRGCVKTNGAVVGDWKIESSAPQGGSLSSPLFQSVLPELEQELTNAGCGIWIDEVFVSCLGYVDDLVLLASSANMLRRALRIAQEWARRVRIWWNIGPNKSAVMLWGRGRHTDREKAATFWIGTNELPKVTEYK